MIIPPRDVFVSLCICLHVSVELILKSELAESSGMRQALGDDAKAFYTVRVIICIPSSNRNLCMRLFQILYKV